MSGRSGAAALNRDTQSFTAVNKPKDTTVKPLRVRFTSPLGLGGQQDASKVSPVPCSAVVKLGCGPRVRAAVSSGRLVQVLPIPAQISGIASAVSAHGGEDDSSQRNLTNTPGHAKACTEACA
jgi:hypothetical protein